MLNFNRPVHTKDELEYIAQVIKNDKVCGDGPFTHMCNDWFEKKTQSEKVLLTTSCTHALEMAALLSDIETGDEIIMPSYTFVSTANAFVLRGAKIVFVDIRPDTMNIDENLIEGAITERTKAIVPVHYAGVSCEMDKIKKIAEKYNLIVIEDAAQGMMSTYKGKMLGTIGDIGCYSFHETKNYNMGEGGAILLNHKEYNLKAEILREKGTNRSQFFRGQIDKYTWVDQGSSYLPSELNAAYLYPQLLMANEINEQRLELWNLYYKLLTPLKNNAKIDLPFVPENCQHNAHMFYIKVKDIEERERLINYLKERDIMAVFHYIPLHSSTAGKKFGVFHGEDKFTTIESNRLLRLPMFFDLKFSEIEYVCQCIYDFFKN
ncbi:dTDP-4-amino-4,6-dideoxygalactose transaminase [Enterococcus viikkiensis]|uniref:dTDP-4-amino-4,6-dideoxygalactose transaminase n=1 Tax=Enterococcus viikkiensis TaxID=930854 RepID=A0ABU3FMS6_9ENTE|nr:dTDP-4-amino-4,6-dideoxygalactose transaminase [Enterococcus viikkiensis]MDT2827206.1 dTDP-4-amino-4,6-dideoxygalactose transaminase [Enterococcus viikkiensis]MDU6522455.1 dTDP-4-amino-4,6-dideoxygalactose transaminase [Enterococcus sp.]